MLSQLLYFELERLELPTVFLALEAQLQRGQVGEMSGVLGCGHGRDGLPGERFETFQSGLARTSLGVVQTFSTVPKLM